MLLELIWQEASCVSRFWIIDEWLLPVLEHEKFKKTKEHRPVIHPPLLPFSQGGLNLVSCFRLGQSGSYAYFTDFRRCRVVSLSRLWHFGCCPVNRC
ncbi:hypothetical protein SAMN05421881_101319 [Nitrosomonas halophila]|uniref:Uncharacterized protein n=1 Tax=Nitrosomonas halophila TaxID=44576 RepID=A0A1H3FUI3_9PROT|nr:hypothetical protein SAMN05421881_101319 [Nitrosomonas halophila]